MTTPAERVLSQLRFLADPDGAPDPLLAGLVEALMTTLDRPALVAHGEPGLPPWRALTDPAVAPAWALPFAAQWTGGRMPPRRPGEPSEDYIARARREVVYPLGMRRGSALTAVEAAREHLTGERTIVFREQFAGDPWQLMVVTRVEETPDPDAMRAAVRRVLPAGVLLVAEVRNERDWAGVFEVWASWADVLSDNATWQEVLVP